MDLLEAVSRWPVATGLRFSTLAYVLVNAAHIVSIALLAGSIATLDLRVLGLFRAYPVEGLAVPLTRVASVGLALAIVTGFLLFTVRPVAYADNPAFLIKLSLVAAGVANAVALRFSRHWLVLLRGGEAHPLVLVSAGVSLAIWLAAVVAGRWIGFLE